MSEYELSLMRQRGLAARDQKAGRGEFRFMLPPGFCWSEAGKIEIDPDEHVAETIRLVFAKFRELGSARQVFLWLRQADLKMPVVRRNVDVQQARLEGARLSQRHADPAQSALRRRLCLRPERRSARRIVDGRARKTSGFAKPREEWNVLLRDDHPGLHQLAGVRGQSEAAARERAHEEELRHASRRAADAPCSPG